MANIKKEKNWMQIDLKKKLCKKHLLTALKTGH